MEGRVSRAVRKFEHAIVLVLMALLVVVITASTAELVWMLIQDFAHSKVFLLDIEEMFELFGFFLLVLIGMELLATLRSYVSARVIHVEVVLEVALIAVAQKIVVLNTAKLSGGTLLGLAGLVLALAAAFWLVRAARRPRAAWKPSGSKVAS